MAAHGSNHSEEPGQYPTTAWSGFGLPEQNFGSGAPGSSAPSAEVDEGSTNEPGQYPGRDDFTGVTYSLGGAAGSGAPGSTGVDYDASPGGGDTITYTLDTFYKSQREDGDRFSEADGLGYRVDTVRGQVSDKGDWTQANAQGYQADAQFQMPGVAGNTPAPGDGRFTTDGANGSGHVMYGGWLKGSRPATSRHRAGSGPGT